MRLPAWFVPEVRAGITATATLARLKQATLTRRQRAKTYADKVGFGIVIIGALLAGDIARSLAASDNPVVTEFLAQLRQGQLGTMGSGALATVLVATLFSPITGAANQAQFPDADLSGIRPSRLYRYFDGVLNTIVSPVGASQLVVLTSLASLITSAGPGRVAALALTWTLWLGMLPAVALSGWVVEYVRRRWTPGVRWWLTGGAVAAVAVAALVDPQHGRTVFGLSAAFGGALAAAGDGRLAPVVVTGAVTVAAAGVIFVTGLVACRRALALPAPVERQRSQSTVRPVHIPDRPAMALTLIVLLALWRSREVRRPILMMLLVAMPLLLAGVSYSGAGSSSVLAAIVMVVPLSMAIGWGVNVFGVLGGALTLLLSQPRSWRLLLRQIALILLGGTLGLGASMMLLAAAVGRAVWAEVPAYAVGLLLASVVSTITALRYSVNRPHRTRLTGRGDPLVPPIVGMEYIVRLMSTGAFVGLVAAVVSAMTPWWVGATIVVITLGYAARQWQRLTRRWSDPLLRAKVAAVVGAV